MTDYLTCGDCLKEFPLQKITLFIQHKKLDCGDEVGDSINDPELQCNYCPQGFMTAWGLLIHAQISHNLKIFLEKASRKLLQGTRLSVKPINDSASFPHSKTDRYDSLAVKLPTSTEPTNLQTRQDTFSSGLVSCSPARASILGSQEAEERDASIAASKLISPERLTPVVPCSDGDVVKPSTAQYSAKTQPSGKQTLPDNKQCVNSPLRPAQDNKEASGSVVVGDVGKCADETSMLDEEPGDCDVQGCGVTVIPGTHQDLQKCCNAVVPKKRKRHMEMKHMTWGTSRYARRRLMNRAAASLKPLASTMTKSSSIYIEVESDPSHMEKHDQDYNNCSAGVEHVTMATDSAVSQPLTSTATVQTLTEADTRPKSLILKPGAIFSIPFTYTIPVTSGLSSFRINPQASTVASGQTSQGAQMSTTGVSQGGARQSVIIPEGMPFGAVRGQRSAKNGDRPAKYSSSKPFHCETCSMSFNQRIHLKKHVMSKHTGNKPYKCGECDYSTVERSHLKVHIRIHTGEKPFKCTYCEYATAQNSTLKIHLKRHHGGKMFHCGACDREFTQEQQLRGHECEHTADSPDKKSSTPTSVSPVTQTSPSQSVVPVANPQSATVCRGNDSTSPQSATACRGDHSSSPLSVGDNSTSPNTNTAHTGPSSLSSCPAESQTKETTTPTKI